MASLALDRFYESANEASDSIMMAIGTENDPEKIKQKFGLDKDKVLNNLFSDHEFLVAIEDLFKILTADVDGDGKLTIADINTTLNRSKEELENVFLDLNILLRSDLSELTSIKLLSNIAMVATKFGNLKVDAGYINQLFLKVLIYQVFVRLAKKNPRLLNDDAIKKLIIDFICYLYVGLTTSKMITVIVEEANSMFKAAYGFCCGSKATLPRGVILERNNRDIQMQLTLGKQLLSEKKEKMRVERHKATLLSRINEVEKTQHVPKKERVVISLE